MYTAIGKQSKQKRSIYTIINRSCVCRLDTAENERNRIDNVCCKQFGKSSNESINETDIHLHILSDDN